MSHARQSIKDQIAASLTGLTTTGTRIDLPRIFGLARAQLPALSVDIIAEEAFDSDRESRYQGRRAMLEIVGYAIETEQGTALSTQLDNIDQEVATALFADVTLNALIKDIEFEGMEKLYTPGEDIHGQIRIRYRVIYGVDQSNPTAVL